MTQHPTSNHLRSFIELNLGIICISTSGVLGKYVMMSSVLVIFYRSLIGMMTMGLICYVLGSPVRLNWRRDGMMLFISAILMGAHWLTYFYALDYTSIAIAMLCLYAHPAITAILEPLCLNIPFHQRDILLGGLVIVGILIMISPEGDMDAANQWGIALGLISALCYSLRNIAVRGLVAVHGSTMMLYQTGIVALLLSPFLFNVSSQGSRGEWMAILGLGIFTSAIGHTLYIQGLKSFRAATVGIISSILPVYGILWGYIFLGEKPDARTMIGGVFILSVVAIKSIMDIWKHKQKQVAL